jgi:hypothetical protein
LKLLGGDIFKRTNDISEDTGEYEISEHLKGTIESLNPASL